MFSIENILIFECGIMSSNQYFILFIFAISITGCTLERLYSDVESEDFKGVGNFSNSQVVLWDEKSLEKKSEQNAKYIQGKPTAGSNVPGVSSKNFKNTSFQQQNNIVDTDLITSTRGLTLNESSNRPLRITVQRGDTLYKISRRYNMTVSSIKRYNDLQDTTIRPGQTLVLTSGSKVELGENLTSNSSEYNTHMYSNLKHVVRPGETLYSISRLRQVSVKELKTLNGIQDPRRLQIGQVLRIAGSNLITNDSGNTKEHVSTIEKQRHNGSGAYDSITHGPVHLSGSEVATTSSRYETEKVVNKVGSDLEFYWPVPGRIIRGFGRLPDGTSNDGINIAVPIGSSVKASESGTVVYAGNELSGYGNLILIRHKKGFVTVYAHLKSMKAKRGDNVHRGDIIARAGNTGITGQPQLHFELRQGAKPIDPMNYLKSM